MTQGCINDCFGKAINLCQENNLNNIKLILSNLSLINDEGNFINTYISNRTGKNKTEVTSSLKRRGFRFEKENIGLNVQTTCNFSVLENLSTVILVIWANPIIIKQIKSEIISFNNDLVLGTSNFDKELQELIKDLNTIKF